MATMTAEPYVWHVPALTGASGGEAVREFYSTQFIGHTPADAMLHPIARTVSADRVIDEFVLEFTHDSEVPWMLPGVAPTGRAIVDAEDERLNPNGGAIAIGHPLGCGGARLLTTLIHELGRRDGAEIGLATMCIGVGQGIAMVIDRG